MAGLGRRVWILVALAVLIVVMLVAVIAINAADGGAPSSSLDTPTTSAVDPARA